MSFVQALPFTSCVITDKSVNISKILFSIGIVTVINIMMFIVKNK